ncbi:MAG: hypothetical protein HQL63_04650 [Magnetococcales bacterium]|nr:hypothetical protein [Magnetococcales bacterium]MBF0323226.1 hypothetical protein [Magnetococcales bacterium]
MDFHIIAKKNDFRIYDLDDRQYVVVGLKTLEDAQRVHRKLLKLREAIAKLPAKQQVPSSRVAPQAESA